MMSENGQPAVQPKILMFRGGDWISWLVRVQTRSPYSHTGLLRSCGCCVIEAYPGAGVRVRKLTEADWGRIDAFDVPSLSPAGWEVAEAFALSQLGKSYDWRGVFRFVDKLPALHNDKWFCSEFVHGSIAQGGVRLLERIESEAVSPAMVPLSPLAVPVNGWTRPDPSSHL